MFGKMRFLLATMLLSNSGCALISATPPSLDVISVRLVGIGLTDQQLSVMLCVTNPNNSEIAFRRVTANLDVLGAPFAAGESDVAVQLPPLSSTAVPFTVVTTMQNLGPQLLGLFRTGRVGYRVHGTVTFRGALGITLPYSHGGELDALSIGQGLASAATSSRCTLPVQVESFLAVQPVII